jgi:hypothetical protein
MRGAGTAKDARKVHNVAMARRARGVIEEFGRGSRVRALLAPRVRQVSEAKG